MGVFRTNRNHRTEHFTLKEGPVTIWYPRKIANESFDDLKAYLDIFLRKVQRPDDPHDPMPPIVPT